MSNLTHGSYRIFWGDTHQNTYTSAAPEVPIGQTLGYAAACLDFYTGAYYTPVMTRVPARADRVNVALEPTAGHVGDRKPAVQAWGGIHNEGTKPAERIAAEWAEFGAALEAAHAPGRFVTFPGYEWQGDGTWGDHNVVFRRPGRPVLTPATLPELYAGLQGLEALAIPHHTGYHTAIRAPRWGACDERLSPFAELFSCHGCSETDEELIGLRHNSHMGPGLGGSTYQDALDAGLHLGAIGSTDNWSHAPGCWGQGLMACLAADLTRDSLWDAFRNRRVYGVTGDRIELDFTCNGAPMGSILPPSARREIRIRVRAADALDRIELLRNGRVIETLCRQGAWDAPAAGAATRFKLRLESGWGPRPGELPFGERRWTGEAELSRGAFTGWQPCWVSQGQQPPRLEGRRAAWTSLSRQVHVQAPFQGGLILEFECDPAAELRLALNGLEARWPVRDLVRASRVLWHRDESIAMLRSLTLADPLSLNRTDPIFYQFAFKTKVHRAVPESGFTADLSVTDSTPLRSEANYRVRVEQRNGQRAWSSPIWVKPG